MYKNILTNTKQGLVATQIKQLEATKGPFLGTAEPVWGGEQFDEDNKDKLEAAHKTMMASAGDYPCANILPPPPPAAALKTHPIQPLPPLLSHRQDPPLAQLSATPPEPQPV
ncbi:hypothetical protein PtA15_1A701 [Puccinia triticina]|uniref:Uncharacterized protein n=1 Tax=Puccinia triticina TaxID=208348 RepID=A0ABY7C864_9BASI|nr:uncharacterized protein PtA15_1A701 [Puccinia triticina]WAQ81361.1 hypothetical protein PtA15_1A701 [Puccinia triticina]